MAETSAQILFKLTPKDAMALVANIASSANKHQEVVIAVSSDGREVDNHKPVAEINVFNSGYITGYLLSATTSTDGVATYHYLHTPEESGNN
jgi:hypothetical protein